MAGSNGNGNTPAKKKRQMSPEARAAASERMKKLHAEGKAGPQFGKMGGRPRKKRATEIIAEEAAEDAQKLLKVYKDGIADDQPISIRLKAAEAYRNIEQSEAKLGMEEEEHVRKMSKEELESHLAQKILGNPMLANRFMELLEDRVAANSNGHEEVIDAEVVPDPELPSGVED